MVFRLDVSQICIYQCHMNTQDRINARIGKTRIAWLRNEAVRLEISINEVFNRLIDQARGVRWELAADQSEAQDGTSSQEKLP